MAMRIESPPSFDIAMRLTFQQIGRIKNCTCSSLFNIDSRCCSKPEALFEVESIIGLG